MAEYAVARLEEIDELTDGREPYRPVRHHLGITAFGATAWTGRDVGDRIINEHDEADEDEELYVVLRGRARFELDGANVDAPAGTFVFAQPGVKRTAYAEEADTTLLAIGSPPGEAYQASGWELWATLNPLYEAGEYTEVADRGAALVEANPGYPAVVYNLACCESLAGRTADALTHLEQAIALSDRSREWARGDSDFDAIRGEPRFRELVGD